MFEQVPWSKLDEAQQLGSLEKVARALEKQTSTAGRLAARALRWALENRRHRRPQAGRQRDSGEPQIDVETFI
jgi:hypothetical protein